MDLFQHEPPIHALDLQHRPPVYDSKTTLEGFGSNTFDYWYLATLDLQVLKVCRSIFDSDFERSRHRTFLISKEKL